MAALLARSLAGVGAAAVGRRALSSSAAVRNGCQPAGPAGGSGSGSGSGSGGAGGSGAGRQSLTASLAAFFTQHPEAAVGAIAAGGAFLYNEVRATRFELRSELRDMEARLDNRLEGMSRRMDSLFTILARGSGAPSGEAAPGDASGDGDAA